MDEGEGELETIPNIQVAPKKYPKKSGRVTGPSCG